MITEKDALSERSRARPEHIEGERRQITVMFCDLVGSTSLSEWLDAEDYRGMIHAYYLSCGQIIKDSETEGFVDRLIGDSILAYFGYPAAQEDAAECAIKASLKIVARMKSSGEAGGKPLDVHIGLATGMTVISHMVGSGFAELHAATGLTPNLAARIQATAPAGTVLVSDETRRLAGDMFLYDDMGMHHFRGLEKPVRVWRVTGKSLSDLRFEAHHPQVLDCVGRDAELRLLADSWKRAQIGDASIMCVRGEAGIGKSRLVRAAADRFALPREQQAVLQCSPHQGETPLHPLTAWIRREARIGGTDHADDLARLENWLGEKATTREERLVIAELVGIPLADAVPPMPSDRKRKMTRDVLVRHFERRVRHAPMLLIIEDAHWMDSATEEFLRSLFGTMRGKHFLALITARPPEQRDWSDSGRARDIVLGVLPEKDARQLVQSACRGRSLPDPMVNLILARTDGVPLFIEELTAAVLQSDLLAQDAPRAMPGAPPTLEIPATLRDILMARLERIPGAKEVARVACALGREFTFSLLMRLTGQQPGELAATLDGLVAAQLLIRVSNPPGAEFEFKHALIPQAAYEGQLKEDRLELHGRIVAAIERHQPEIAAREPGLMAHYCHEAKLPDKEAHYLYQAGKASTRVVAITEALAYFSRAADVVATLEPTPEHLELHIRIILGMMEAGRFAILPKRLMELGALARRLARTEGVECDAATMSSILFQEGRALLYTSHYNEAARVFNDIRELGRATGSAAIEIKPGSALTMGLCCQGLFSESLEFIHERNVTAYKETGNFIDYLAGLGWLSYALCQVGPAEGGLRFADQSVREAELLQSPIYAAGAHVWRSHALMALRRFDEAIVEARQCVELSEVHAVPYLGWHGLVFLALCLCRAGRFDEALDVLQQARGLLDREAEGQWSLLDYLPAIEAEIACFRGEHVRALDAADQAIERAQSCGGHFAEAMAWRVKAVSSAMQGRDPLESQSFFDNADVLYDRGGARAEQVFSTLTWAHALQRSGHPSLARAPALRARDQARLHGFQLKRCEYGGYAML